MIDWLSEKSEELLDKLIPLFLVIAIPFMILSMILLSVLFIRYLTGGCK